MNIDIIIKPGENLRLVIEGKIHTCTNKKAIPPLWEKLHPLMGGTTPSINNAGYIIYKNVKITSDINSLIQKACK